MTLWDALFSPAMTGIYGAVMIIGAVVLFIFSATDIEWDGISVWNLFGAICAIPLGLFGFALFIWACNGFDTLHWVHP